jgi:hypothetical protein
MKASLPPHLHPSRTIINAISLEDDENRLKSDNQGRLRKANQRKEKKRNGEGN